MRVQKSNNNHEGILYLVATPIGNLGDMSERALNILKEVDLIAAEDTRHTRKLLSHFQFSTPLVSYHEHNEKKQQATLLECMKKGQKVALVSDAGTPAISDPGELLVQATIAAGIPVIPVPGPNAAISALIASGLPVQPFLFIGFLSRKHTKRKEQLRQYGGVSASLICYESPYRILSMLRDVQSELGERGVAIVRELTKKHEEWLRGTVSECCEWIEQKGVRGEYTVIIAPGADEKLESAGEWWQDLTLGEHVVHYIDEGQSKKEAIQKVAKERRLPKREVYNHFEQLRD